MNVQLKSTTKIVELNGVPARVWEGVTESGIECHAFITRIAVADFLNTEEFEKELKECEPPSEKVNEAYPLRMVL